MVQIAVIQGEKVTGLVVCRKIKQNCVRQIIWDFGTQNALNIAITRFVGATIVILVALTRVHKLTGIVVTTKILFQVVQRF
jgi:hypothetical protein